MKLIYMALLVGCSSLFAEAVIRDSVKMGIGFSGQANELGINLDLTTPSLVHFKTNSEKTRSDLYLYLEVADQYINNLAQSAGTFIAVNNIVLSSGIRMQHQLPDGSSIVSPYSTIGAELAFPNSLISTSSTSFALRVGFGCDLIFVRAIDTLLGTSDSSFFVEGNINFFHRKADKLAGSPSWREGFTPRVGIRSHF